MPNTAPSHTASEASPNEQLHIAVGVIRDTRGRILISQRREGTAGAGLWEFPGGKCEDGESILEALERELREELGITVRGARPMLRIRHAYPDRHVLLDTWLVESWEGDAYGCEGQKLTWVAADALPQWDLLPANAPISNAARLPERLLVTPEPSEDTARFLGSLRASLGQGIRLVRLRAPTMNDNCYAALAQACLPICHSAGAALLLDRDAALVEAVGADGMHLSSQALMGLTERPAMAGWLAASCHSEQELRQAEALGCDFVLLGTLKSTASHPHAAAMGWSQAAELIDTVNLPVYAIGGLGPGDLTDAFNAGAQGIAAIRSLWAETADQEKE